MLYGNYFCERANANIAFEFFRHREVDPKRLVELILLKLEELYGSRGSHSAKRY